MKNFQLVSIGFLVSRARRVPTSRRYKPIIAVLVLVTLIHWESAVSIAQDSFPPVSEKNIRRIQAQKINESISIDGLLNEAAWKLCPASPEFVDLISGKAAIHSTAVKVLWDESFLYVGYEIEEPFVRAKFTERDSPIYQDNDVELFIAGEDAYYEFEINALGTVYEGLFVWQSNYESSGINKLPGLDNSRADVRCQSFNGVGYKLHPRGLRWAFLDWDFPRAKTAVYVDGTLNNDADRDRGWSVELAFPWSEMALLNMSQKRALPPQPGDVWRMDFSRFNQYKEAPPADDSGGWALSHHGVWDSHIPECFPFVTFADETTAAHTD